MTNIKNLIKISILMLVLSSIFIIPTTAATVTSQTTIMSDGLFGDSVIRVTYSDGTTADILKRGIANELRLKLSSLSISYTEPGTTLTIPTGGTVEFTIGILGVGLDNQNCHATKLDVFDKDTGTLLKTIDYGCLANQKFFPDLSGKILNLGTVSQRGTYSYKIQEMVQLQSPSTGSLSWVRGDVVYLTAIVGGGALPIPTPTPYTAAPTPAKTAAPGYTAAPTPVPTVTKITKPVIIPPDVSRLLSAIWASIKGLFGLTIQGGAGVDIPAGKPYSTTMSLLFNSPDSDYTDGKYQTVFAEWFIADSTQAVKTESGWVELTNSPYTASAAFTPATVGKYYLVGVVVKQDYTWDAAGQKWNVVETIETKEIQELNAKTATITPPTTTKPALSSIWSGLWSFIRSIFPW